jgi:hypothetical protein
VGQWSLVALGDKVDLFGGVYVVCGLDGHG